MNFTCVFGFGLVGGVVKVFPFSSLSLAKKINQEGASTTRPIDDIGSHVARSSPRRNRLDVGDRLGAGRCMRTIERSQAESLTNSWLNSHCEASAANCCTIAHTQSGPTRRRSWWDVVIRAQPARSFLVDFLANKRELTGKTFTTPLASQKS